MTQRPQWPPGSAGRADWYGLDPSGRLRPHHIDVKQAVLQGRALDLHAVGKDEGAQETARCDPAMEVGAFLALAGFGVPPAGDDQLAVLDGHLQLLGGKPGDRQGDAEAPVVALLDIVRRIGFGGGLGGPLDQRPRVLETEQERAIDQQAARHGRSPRIKRLARRRRARIRHTTLSGEA